MDSTSWSVSWQPASTITMGSDRKEEGDRESERVQLDAGIGDMKRVMG